MRDFCCPGTTARSFEKFDFEFRCDAAQQIIAAANLNAARIGFAGQVVERV